MEHHADFAIPCPHRLFVETSYERPDGGLVAGRVLALGWWVDAGAAGTGAASTGTLYLIADETLPRPVWAAQGRLTGFRLLDAPD
jgi:hypothetical protein